MSLKPRKTAWATSRDLKLGPRFGRQTVGPFSPREPRETGRRGRGPHASPHIKTGSHARRAPNLLSAAPRENGGPGPGDVGPTRRFPTAASSELGDIPAYPPNRAAPKLREVSLTVQGPRRAVANAAQPRLPACTLHRSGCRRVRFPWRPGHRPCAQVPPIPPPGPAPDSQKEHGPPCAPPAHPLRTFLCARSRSRHTPRSTRASTSTQTRAQADPRVQDVHKTPRVLHGPAWAHRYTRALAQAGSLSQQVKENTQYRGGWRPPWQGPRAPQRQLDAGCGEWGTGALRGHTVVVDVLGVKTPPGPQPGVPHLSTGPGPVPAGAW